MLWRILVEHFAADGRHVFERVQAGYFRVVDHADDGDAHVDALYVLDTVAEEGDQCDQESYRNQERRRFSVK